MTRLIKRFTQEIKERNLQFTGFAALVCTFVFSILVFFGIYNVFIDTALYKERLNQMENVTKQLFTNWNLSCKTNGKALTHNTTT